MPTYSLCAMFNILQASPAPRTQEDTNKLITSARDKYNLVDILHVHETLPIKDRSIFVPSFLAGVKQDSIIYTLKGVDKPCIALDPAVLAPKLVGQCSLLSFSSLEEALRALFPPSKSDSKTQDTVTLVPTTSSDKQVLVVPDSPISEQLAELNEKLAGYQKSMDDLKAAFGKNAQTQAPTAATSSMKDIRNAEKSFMDFLKSIDPISGTAKDDFSAKDFVALQDVPAPNHTLSGESNSIFDVKSFARGEKDGSKKVLLYDNGKLVTSDKIKKKIENVNDWNEANCSILEKISQDPNAASVLPGYTAYMTRIAAYVKFYDWENVYKYDKEYRRVRHKAALPWNWPIPNLTEILTRPLPRKSKAPAASSSTPKGSDNTPRHKKQKVSKKATTLFCYDFNNGHCDRGKSCFYGHWCKFCNTKGVSAARCSCESAKSGREGGAPKKPLIPSNH